MNKQSQALITISLAATTSLLLISSKKVNVQDQVDQQQLNEHSVLAINWVQKSAEYTALSHQAFNIATTVFDTALVQEIKNPAVIVDIDETVLDNSQYQASMIDTDKQFSSGTWNAWINAREAVAIPGAIEFVNYVNAHNGKVFFISDRNVSSQKGSKNNDLEISTIANLKKLGFSGVDSSTVLLKGEFTKVINKKENMSKQFRREAIQNGFADGKIHKVVALVGDNLNDFDDQAGDSNRKRREYVDDHRDQYGSLSVAGESDSLRPAYIILPNPMYGAWEQALYNPSNFGKKEVFDMTASEKNQQRKEALIR